MPCLKIEVNENFGYQSLNGDIASLVRNRGLYPFVRYHLFFPFFYFQVHLEPTTEEQSMIILRLADSASSILHDNGLFHIQISTK